MGSDSRSEAAYMTDAKLPCEVARKLNPCAVVLPPMEDTFSADVLLIARVTPADVPAEFTMLASEAGSTAVSASSCDRSSALLDTIP